MTTNDLQEEPHSDELVFGMVAPIGVNIDLATEVLAQSLKEFQYETEMVRVTNLMKQVEIGLPFDSKNYIEQIRFRIKYGNKLRAELQNDALAILSSKRDPPAS